MSGFLQRLFTGASGPNRQGKQGWPIPPPSRDPAYIETQKLLAPSRVLSLPEYVTALGDVPLPAAGQIENFVEYVTTAHSWYKHLPPYPPGAPFYFFFDRFAGCEYRGGDFSEKKEPGLHYSDLPTAEYRTRFGFLSYCAWRNSIRLLESKCVSTDWDALAASLGRDAQLAAIPQTILEAGRVELTAFIHPSSQSYDHWDQAISPMRPKVEWPVDSGGKSTLARLWKRCAEMRQPGYQRERNLKKRQEISESLKARGEVNYINYLGVDPVLHELLEPERVRQKREMLKAIDRVCQLIREARSSQAVV